MRALVDENLPRRAAVWLRGEGVDAVHVLEVLGAGGSDSDVWKLALDERRTILTRDRDFVGLLAAASAGSVVVIRVGNCTVAALLDWLGANWPAIALRLEAGETLIEEPSRGD